MADLAVTTSTVVNRNVTGNQRTFVSDVSSLTTSAGADTVATPLSVVDYVTAQFNTTNATTNHVIQAFPSTETTGAFVAITSTHDGFAVRYEVKGR